MRFASAVGAGFERFALLSRSGGDRAGTPHALSGNAELVPLPYYESLRDLAGVLAATPRTLATMWRALDELDVVWVSGIHPLGLALVAMAKLRGRRAVLLIRQDSPRYFASRLPSRAWRPLLAPLRALDWAFRLLGRRLPTTAVGPVIAAHYGAPRPNVLEMRVSLLEDSQIAALPPPASGRLEEASLLAVGRIAAEKTPLLAAEVLASLERSDPGRFAFTWIGEGPLADALRARGAELGVSDRLTLPGYVEFGPDLIARYREADVFVHLSRTEGVPGVLYEAMGSGLPIVASDVGGVGAALERGAAGILVPAGDAEATAAAIRRLADEPGLRDRLRARGLELARGHTLSSEAARVRAFLAADTA
jgi:glycosyltransferase involved in cell wall biosynthesis